MVFLNDEYTLDINELGYKKQADTIRDMILNCKTPFTLGVSGKWGSGKTSLMKYVMASLGGEPLSYRFPNSDELIEELVVTQKSFKNVRDKYKNQRNIEHIHTIWFNPWEHENEEEPFVALLREIRDHFDYVSKFGENSSKIMHTTFQAGLDMLGSVLSLGKNQGSNIVEIGKKYEHDNFQSMSRNQRLRLMFKAAVEKLLSQKVKSKVKTHEKAKLIIFIDDLDRCEEETIGKLLREIKQHLTTERCVFVFGYDRHHVEKSLARSLSRSTKETRAYIEKLFQTTFYIKEPDSKYLKSFINQIFLTLELTKKVQKTDVNDIIEFISLLLDGNPRRIKTFLNSFYIHFINTSFSKQKIINKDDIKKLILINYLKIYYEPIYAVLENKNDFLTSIVKVCSNNDRNRVENQQQHFVFLEFSSHIHALDATAYMEENTKVKVMEKEYEEKFLTEVYEMQGKYRSFEKFSVEFKAHFSGFNHINIPQYL